MSTAGWPPDVAHAGRACRAESRLAPSPATQQVHRRCRPGGHPGPLQGRHHVQLTVSLETEPLGDGDVPGAVAGISPTTAPRWREDDQAGRPDVSGRPTCKTGRRAVRCGTLSAMVEYADFHVLIATLAPVALLAGLVAHSRVRVDDPSALRQFLAGGTVGLTVALTLSQVYLSLEVLAGFRNSSEPLRRLLLFMLTSQLVIGIALAIWDARFRR